MPTQKGLGFEHPRCDALQIVFISGFLVIWGLDSFLFQVSTGFAKLIHVLIRLALGTLSVVFGMFFTRSAHNTVFNNRNGNPQLITTGVYARVRHPMYFGTLLISLGLAVTTLSLLSFLLWAGLAIFYDTMASYEEQNLLQLLGNQYCLYQQQVSKWLLPINIGLLRNTRDR